MKKKFRILLIYIILMSMINVVNAAEELPDNGAIVSSVQIIQRKTGTSPFDSDNTPGNDSTDDNNIVRSFDQVMWTIENTMALNGGSANSYTGGKIYFEAKLPSVFTSETAKWDLDSMKWIEGLAVSDDGLGISGYYSLPKDVISVPGKQTLVFVAKILGASNGTTFKPTITTWLNGNSESEHKVVEVEDIVVSAAPKYNVRLSGHGSLQKKVTVDYNGKSITGRVYGYGIGLQLYNDSVSKGLKGIEYPKGKITFEIDTLLEKVAMSGNSDIQDITSNCTPFLWDYKINEINVKGKLGRDMNFGREITGYACRSLPWGINKDAETSVFNSGNVTINQNGSKLYVSIEGYKFNGVFPTHNSAMNSKIDPIVYRENIGCFSSVYFEMIVPDNEYSIDENYNYYLTLKDLNFAATSISDKKITTQAVSNDDGIKIQHYIHKSGAYSQDTRVMWVDREPSPYTAGNGWVTIGKTFNIWASTICAGANDEENSLYTINKLIKYDGEAFEPVPNASGQYFWNSTAEFTGENFTYKMWFVTKKDGTNWVSQSERNEAKVEDLVLYSNIEDIPVGHLCVGIYCESQSGCLTNGYSIIRADLKVKDTAKIGMTYAVSQNTLAWSQKLDRSIYTVTNPDVEWPETTFENQSGYIKTEYNNGMIVSGTHNSGNVMGQSLLIIGGNLSVSKNSVDENDNEKINYDFTKNEYEVKYKIVPNLVNASLVGLGAENITLKVEETLPSGLSYLAGSSNYGEPEIVKNSNGTSVLTWYINDVKINKKLEPIVYKATISNDLTNGTRLETQTKISEVPSKDEQGNLVYKIGNLPISNSSNIIAKSSIQIINLSSHRIYKSIETPVVEKNGEIHYTVSYKNNTDEIVPSFQFLDILPYNGDGRGTSFNGTYTLDRLVVTQEDGNGNKLPNNNLEILYTNDSSVRGSVTSKDENLGAGWSTVTSQDIKQSVTAIAIKGEVGSLGKVTVDIYLKTSDNQGADKYVNSATAQVYENTEEMVTSGAISQVVSRKIEGIAWEDSNANGIKDDDEELLKDIEVTIADEHGMQVTDVNGNAVTSIKTNEEGYYVFENLPKQNYYLSVKMPNSKYTLTSKEVGSNTEINSKFNEETNQTDVITKLNSIDLPELVVSNENIGIVKKKTKVIVNYKEDVTNTILHEQVEISGRIDDAYEAEDKIAIINELNGNKYELARVEGNISGNMTQDIISVTYYYQKKQSKVEVRYLELGTNNELEPLVTLTGRVDEDYTTEDKLTKINEINNNKYEFAKVEGNINGKYTVDTQNVTYYYQRVANVTTRYIDENTNENIIDDVITKYNMGEEYTTEKKILDGYTYTKDTGNTTGEVGRDDIEVIYYYKKISSGVEIKYIDQSTGEAIADTIIKTGVENEAYTSEAKEIEGYRLVVTPTNANGHMSVEKIVVTYEYRKLSNVVTRYIDENHGTSLSESVQATYMEQESYSTEKKIIDGYTYTTDTKNTTGTVGRDNIEVTYYYKKNTSVIVKYVDMLDGNKEISKAITIPGLENQDYTTEQKEIEGYVFEEVEGIANGKMSSDTTEVIYKYKKVSNLITEHIDENTGEKITEDVIKTYKEGENYEALSQNIEGYVVTREPEEKTGVMGRENITKTYYYKKISGGLTVKYVDSVLGELLDQEEYSGNEGDVIKLEEKDIAGYVIVEKPNYTEVTLSEEPREVIYYYKRAVKIDVIGIDTDTKEELYKTDISGIEGEEYTTEARDVEGYELVVIPENKNGIFKRNNPNVVYEYKMLSGKLTVRYIDKETNEELDSYEISGKVGDNFKTDKKEFTSYNFIEVVGEEVGILDKEDKEIVYYYERKTGTVVVRYIDEVGNELLREEMTGKVEEKYVVEQKEIEGYDIVEAPENLEGKYKEGVTELIFIVSKSDVKPTETGKITVNFIDKNGNIIYTGIVEENLVGEKFYIEAPEIEGYRIVGEKEVMAVFERGELIFDIVYEKIDENGNPISNEAPNTGDIAVIALGIIAIISVAGIIFVIVKNRNKK